MGGDCYSGISDKDRKKFDDGLKRIQNSQERYRQRKQEDRRRIERRKKQKQAELRKKKQLNNIAKRNTSSNKQRLIRLTEEYRGNTKAGGCYTDLVSGAYICK